MSMFKAIFQRKPVFVALFATLLVAILIGMGVGRQNVVAATSLPCDIYASGGTPCVAAHSTVRALFAAYSGNLYQVKRASDSTTTNIGTLAAGGYANAAAQDTFCSGTSCTIVQIYDQSGRGNHLTVAPAGGNGSADSPSNATALKLTVAGHSVYGLYIAAGNGYRRNSTSGIPTGSASAGTYMVASGTHVNSGCCFDYGNAETNNNDNGNGHMGAVYLGKLCWFSPCNGSGPWVMADLENGLFSGSNGSYSGNTSVAYTYVTGMVKNTSTNYAIRAGNAASGSLKTMYSGALPSTSGYRPLKLEGAIILGIGGDNSKVAVGSFFEGAMTSGQPSDATEDSVQANIVATYGSTTPTPTPTPTLTPLPGSTTIQAESGVIGGGTTIDTNHTGYNGTGFANFSVTGGYVEFQNVNGGTGGSHTLTFRFALGATSARTAQLLINGVSQNITVNPTGSWDTWVTQTVTVTLNPGTGNTIRLQTNGQDLGNLDQITIS
jgi:non-reducing end alpha-L-arabinofuranosidase